MLLVANGIILVDAQLMIFGRMRGMFGSIARSRSSS
jgi:hypothetical protein